MMISISRRTDIPAFYTPWLMQRLRAGFCHVQNPFGGQVSRVSLAAEDVIVLSFWTRNPAPLMRCLDELDALGYRYYFGVTLTGYPDSIETHNPDLQAAIRSVQRLAQRLSPAQVRWRYDPIILSSATPEAYHLQRFAAIAQALEGYTRHCIISFLQFYGKTGRNLGRVSQQSGIRFENPGQEAQKALLGRLAETAERRGIRIYSCCNDALLDDRVQKNQCIDPEIVRSLAPEAPLPKLKPTRPDCGCLESVDIGAYDTCLFGCSYCYATHSRRAAQERRRAHDPSDTILWRSRELAGKDLDSLAAPPSRRPQQPRLISLD